MQDLTLKLRFRKSYCIIRAEVGNIGNVSYNTEEIFITHMKVTIRNQTIFIFKQLCH